MNRKHAQHAPEYGARRVNWKPDAEEDRATVAFVGVVVFWFVVGVVFALTIPADLGLPGLLVCACKVFAPYYPKDNMARAKDLLIFSLAILSML